MKAHRKKAEGCALIEVMQKAAEMTGRNLPERFRKMSSLKPVDSKGEGL
jgi:hypothetical protein